MGVWTYYGGCMCVFVCVGDSKGGGGGLGHMFSKKTKKEGGGGGFLQNKKAHTKIEGGGGWGIDPPPPPLRTRLNTSIYNQSSNTTNINHQQGKRSRAVSPALRDSM